MIVEHSIDEGRTWERIEVEDSSVVGLMLVNMRRRAWWDDYGNLYRPIGSTFTHDELGLLRQAAKRERYGQRVHPNQRHLDRGLVEG